MKILIIEDDKSIAELEMDYLSANGFAVSYTHLTLPTIA